jgi:hypothetical protein
MVLALEQNHIMNKKERDARIAQEMRQHISSWQASNKTSREYCTDNGLAVHKLYYWLNKIKKSQPVMDDNPPAGFLRVRPKAVPSTSQSQSSSILPSLEANLSNGTRLVFYHAISKDLLNLFL